jgi:hypothetical protein
MLVKNLRKGSRGLDGTFENIECHAPNALLVVTFMVNVIRANAENILEWAQAHNVHIIKAHDGRMLECRPFQPEVSALDGVTGVEVFLRLSRNHKEKLFVIHQNNVALFALFFPEFLKDQKNTYGIVKKEIKND